MKTLSWRRVFQIRKCYVNNPANNYSNVSDQKNNLRSILRSGLSAGWDARVAGTIPANVCLLKQMFVGGLGVFGSFGVSGFYDTRDTQKKILILAQ